MSVMGVLISMILVGTGFFMINKDSAKILSNPNDGWFHQDAKDYDLCRKYSNCDLCVTDERCGFCAKDGSQKVEGYCLPVNTDFTDTRSSTGYCNTTTTDTTDDWHNITTDGKNYNRYEWSDEFCLSLEEVEKLFMTKEERYRLENLKHTQNGYANAPTLYDQDSLKSDKY
uniref:Uncharacterized protein n=1 Tax=Acrobeloides nanus TaxID=290746 RepID=A0A914DIC5_9BILA